MLPEPTTLNLPLSDDTRLSLRGRLVCASLLLLAGAVYALFSFYVPYIGDDYSLPVDWMEANGGVKEFSWERLWNFALYSRSIDNARLDNILFMAIRMSLLPKWIPAFVVGLSASALLWGCGLLCTPRRKDLPFVIAAFWGWMTFTFSWRFGTMGIDNSFNVLLPSAMTVWFLLMMRRVAEKKVSATALTVGCVYAFICGWIHEGYAVPVGCGLGVWALSRRFRMSRQWWILTAVFAVAAVYVVSAPGLWMRAVAASANGAAVNIKTMVTLSVPVWALLGVLCVAVVARFRDLKRLAGRCWAEPMTMVAFVAFVVSVAIVMKSSVSNPRALWICNLFASIVMFRLLRFVFVTWAPRVLSVLAVCAVALITVFYANVIRVQRQICREEYEIERQMAESESGTVFRDYSVAMSKLTLLHPVNDYWRDQLHINNYNLFYPGEKIYSVVPSVLAGLTGEMVGHMENYDPAAASDERHEGFPERVAGSAGLFSFGGELIMPDGQMVTKTWFGATVDGQSQTVMLDYECEDGRRFDAMGSVKIRFRTRDGRSLIYVAPGHYKVTGPYKSVSLSE